MTRDEIKSEVYYISKTNVATYPDVDFNAGLDIIRKRIAMKLIRIVTEWNFQGEIASYALTSITGLSEGDVGYKGEYPFPADLLKFIRMDLNYSTDFKKAEMYFMNDLDDSEESTDEMNAVATEMHPKVKIYRDSFFVRPLPTTTVAGGLQIKYQMSIEDLASDSSEPSEINEMFHEIYVYAMAIRYGTRYPEKMKNEWKAKYNELETELLKYYTERFARNMKIKPKEEDFS